MKLVAQAGLYPAAYADPLILEREKRHLLQSFWQWAGLIDDARKPGGLTANIGGIPIVVEEKTKDTLEVRLVSGDDQKPMPKAMAERCGRFVFVLLNSSNESPCLDTFLGPYAEVLLHATEQFDEVFDARTEEWACNWKSGYEITLEGYHVPFVHGQSYDKNGRKITNFANAVPTSTPAKFNGPHSTHTGIMSDQMRAEMLNIAKRLKINPSSVFTNYDHYALFPNMTVGFSGGCLCFMQIYSPLDVGRTQVRYVYIMARPIDAAQKPVPVIKATLLNAWRDYTTQVLGEDKVACENFQLGVTHATKLGSVGKRAEKRVFHFHNGWRDIMNERISA